MTPVDAPQELYNAAVPAGERSVVAAVCTTEMKFSTWTRKLRLTKMKHKQEKTKENIQTLSYRRIKKRILQNTFLDYHIRGRFHRRNKKNENKGSLEPAGSLDYVTMTASHGRGSRAGNVTLETVILEARIELLREAEEHYEIMKFENSVKRTMEDSAPYEEYDFKLS